MSDSKSTQSPESRQLSLFSYHLDERVRRVEIDGVVYFSILDTFEYGGSQGSAKGPSTYWTRAKKRLLKQGADEVLTQVLDRHNDANLTALSDRSDSARKGGKPTPVAPFKFFLRLAQVVEIKEWEPIRHWMAETAHERLEEMADPLLGVERAKERARKAYLSQGKDQKWIESRLEERLTRRAFTDAIKQYVAGELNYAQVTNDVYKGVTGYDAQGLREKLGITKGTPMDKLSMLAVQYIGIANTVCSIKLERLAETDLVDPYLARDIIIAVSQQIGIQADDMARALGVDQIGAVTSRRCHRKRNANAPRTGPKR